MYIQNTSLKLKLKYLKNGNFNFLSLGLFPKKKSLIKHKPQILCMIWFWCIQLQLLGFNMIQIPILYLILFLLHFHNTPGILYLFEQYASIPHA